MATIPSIPHILLITGAPGVGKTSVLRKVAEELGSSQICGFYTEELREQGLRRGFQLVGFDGTEDIIAHVDMSRHLRVGKYGVDVSTLDRLARASLALHADCAVYLVDEIGKMECLAPGFVTAMRKLLDSDKPLVASVSKKGGGFIGEVKSRSDIELLEVTHNNRASLPTHVLRWLGQRGVKVC